MSSGFDASYLDPLGTMMVTAECFGHLAKSLVDLNVPIVFVHEGGYSENHAPFCGLRVVEAMMGLSESPVKTTDDEEVRAIEERSDEALRRAKGAKRPSTANIAPFRSFAFLARHFARR